MFVLTKFTIVPSAVILHWHRIVGESVFLVVDVRAGVLAVGGVSADSCHSFRRGAEGCWLVPVEVGVHSLAVAVLDCGNNILWL